MTEAGERLETVRIVNDPDRLAAVMARAGKAPEVVLEATYGWYWAADTLPRAGCLGASGASVGSHGLLLPPGEQRRARRGRPGRPAADGPPAAGLDRAAGDPRAAPAGSASRQAGRAALERHLPGACGAGRLRGARDDERPVRRRRIRPAGPAGAAGGVSRPDRLRRGRSWACLDGEIEAFSTQVSTQLRGDPRYRVLQTMPGIGPVLAAVFLAEIADVTRFAGPAQLTSWAGLTPRHRGPTCRCTGAGSPSRAAEECAGRRSRPSNEPASTPASAGSAPGPPPAAGRTIGVAAAARELLTLVFSP